MLFAEQPALTLSAIGEPTLHAFCGSDNPVPDAAVPPSLARLARTLQHTAETSLDRGLDPKVLTAWTAASTQACLQFEQAGDATVAEALALAGAVRSPGKATALTPFAPLKAEWLAQYPGAVGSDQPGRRTRRPG